MSSYKLTEITVNLIIAHIKANISGALSDVRTDRADAKVSTEPPVSFFRYYDPGPKVYRPPAVLVISKSFDFRLSEGPNYIYGLETVDVGILVEDHDRDALTLKAWRYQAALAKLLNNTALTNAGNTVKIVTKLIRYNFSEPYTDAGKKGSTVSVFRKEVVLELEVEHYEQI